MNLNHLYHLRKYRQQSDEIRGLDRKLKIIKGQREYWKRVAKDNADYALEREKQVKNLEAKVKELSAELNREKADNQIIKILYPKEKYG